MGGGQLFRVLGIDQADLREWLSSASKAQAGGSRRHQDADWQPHLRCHWDYSLPEKWRHAGQAAAMANHASTRTTQLYDRRFLRPTGTDLSRFRGTFHSFDPVGFAIFAIPIWGSFAPIHELANH